MKYDVAIFDIDGTLWNATASSAKGMNAALKELRVDKRLSAEDVQSVSGKPSDKVLPALLGADLLKNNPHLEDRLDKGERHAIAKYGGDVYEGVQEGIRKLSEHMKVFLVSNCDDWYLDSFIGFAGIGDYLTGADCYGVSNLSKADMIKKIVKDHDAKHAVYIGDTGMDQAASEEAKVDFIGARYGFGDFSAKKYFHSFPEIVEELMKE